MIRRILNCLVAATMLLHLTARSEDIDLFVGITPSAADVPNVLIVLDNTANWNTPFEVEKAALKAVLEGLPADKFRVGLMMFTETGGGNSGEDGAYVRAAVRLMDASTKTTYAALVNSLDVTADKSNGGKVAKAIEEAYLYFSGGTPYSGNGKVKTDYTGNTSGTSQSKAVYGLTANALASKGGGTYTSPILPGCAKNYIIYISNGAAQDNTSDLDQAAAVLRSLGGASATNTIALNPSGSQDNVADEWARWLKKGSPQKITTYTIDINKVTNGQGPGWTALLKSMAAQSAGKYFDVSSGVGTEILDALNNIFSEIQSVNSVFASVSLPVSVNTQGTYLNQVYVGMFRPDQNTNPRWAGNLKQYKLGMSGGVLRLQDADSRGAINNQTGFITECARSFWTPSTVDTEWTFRPQGDCLTVTNSQVSNYPDGNVVDKGAQAYRLRAASNRTVVTCTPGSSLACSTGGLLAFTSSVATKTLLGAGDDTERDAIVDWAIGQDNKEDEDLDANKTERRLSLHGDVVHSRPVAVNFGAAGSASNVVVFYGANDGMLRAVNGNRTNAITAGTVTVPAGGELWSFMPPEFYPSIRRLRENEPRVQFPTSTGGTPTPAPKTYGMDGPITAFKGTVRSADRTFIYATMRRGGRALYAFDVTSSITSPTSPTLKWKAGCAADGTGCSTDMEGIGQTWSSAKTFTTVGYDLGNKPLLVMGGGYDTCEDHDARTVGGMNHNCTASSGHFVYVLDADTGAVVKTFDTGQGRGVVADVTLVRDATGHVIYGYTADLGGNVYRINFAGAAAAWTMTRIAALGCDGNGTCGSTDPNRKFMFAPSVIAANGVATTTSEYILLIGSGDREKPLSYYSSATAVANRFFKFSDNPSDATWPGTSDCGANLICPDSLFPITGNTAPSTAELGTKKGWSLALSTTEQVVTSAITIFGVVTFSTHQPAVPLENSCGSNLGTTRVYNISYINAASVNGTDSRYEDVAGDGLPPSPVAGQVTLDNGQTVPFCIGCSANSPLEGAPPRSLSFVNQPKGRLYWYIQK